MQIILILENPPLFHLPFLPYDNLAYTALNVFWFTVICPFSQPTVPLSNNESRPSSLHSYLNLSSYLPKQKHPCGKKYRRDAGEEGTPAQSISLLSRFLWIQFGLRINSIPVLFHGKLQMTAQPCLILGRLIQAA